ncbi:MAG: hypothetical protein B7Y26_06865 [Hydrogenophilales bacterium 16-64-46]|nr:MAG: hypothetical protein B7Y26_06865 [Hydrogenophilales bacterium 16-64-46]
MRAARGSSDTTAKRNPHIAFALVLSASALAGNSTAPHAHQGMAIQGEVSRYPAQFQRFIREVDRDKETTMSDTHRPWLHR